MVKVRFQPLERSTTYKRWVTHVALGASKNATGWLLGNVEGFGEDGEDAFQLADGMYRRKKLPQEENGPLKFKELSNVDDSHATNKWVHMLGWTGEKWFPFADPIQQTGWIVDIRISSSFIVTGKQHGLEDSENSTRLCSYIPKMKNIVISESYMLKTNKYKSCCKKQHNGKHGAQEKAELKICIVAIFYTSWSD